MKEELKAAIRQAAAPLLEVGETIEVEASAAVGEVSFAKKMAQALVVGILTLGFVTAYSKPRVLFMVLTDRRLIFLEPSAMAGKPTSKVAAEIPRAALTTISSKPKRVLGITPTLVVDLGIAGAAKGLRLQFGTPVRAEGARIAEALAVHQPA